MRRVGNVLLLIGGILGIITAVTLLAGGLVFMVLSGPAAFEAIKNGIETGAIHVQGYTGGDATLAAQAVQLTFLICGIVFLAEAVLNVASTVLCFLGKNRQTSSLYIANVVIGVFGGSVFAIIGGILGAIDNTVRQ